MAVVVQRHSRFPLLSVHLHISTDRSASDLLQDIASTVVDDSVSFPADLWKNQGKLLGKVQGNSFTFARLHWWRNEVTPRCVGKISAVDGKALLDANISGWFFLISPAIMLTLIFLIAGWRGRLIPIVMLLGVTLVLHIKFWQGVQRLETILLDFANPK